MFLINDKYFNKLEQDNLYTFVYTCVYMYMCVTYGSSSNDGSVAASSSVVIICILYSL
jgi:hypothetical protein